MIKRRHGFLDLTRPVRAELAAWLEAQAIGTVDGRVLLDQLIERMRADRIIIPGVSVIERMAAAAMHAADTHVIAEVGGLLNDVQRADLDALLSEKAHARQSRLSGCASHRHALAAGHCSSSTFFARPAPLRSRCGPSWRPGSRRWRVRACGTPHRPSSR